jgi:hypothetical protein
VFYGRLIEQELPETSHSKTNNHTTIHAAIGVSIFILNKLPSVGHVVNFLFARVRVRTNLICLVSRIQTIIIEEWDNPFLDYFTTSLLDLRITYSAYSSLVDDRLRVIFKQEPLMNKFFYGIGHTIYIIVMARITLRKGKTRIA